LRFRGGEIEFRLIRACPPPSLNFAYSTLKPFADPATDAAVFFGPSAEAK
jgi:hypothetical protein